MTLLEETIRAIVREEIAAAEKARATSDPDEILDTTDIAKELHFTPAAVRLWCSTGILTHERVGTRYRVRRADLTAFIKGRKRNPRLQLRSAA